MIIHQASIYKMRKLQDSATGICMDNIYTQQHTVFLKTLQHFAVCITYTSKACQHTFESTQLKSTVHFNHPSFYYSLYFTVIFQHQFDFVVVVFHFMTNGCFTAMKREDDLHPPQERLTNTEARKNQDHTGDLMGSALAVNLCHI